MKVLFGTYDECSIWAKRHGLKRSEWKHWNGILVGLRLKADDIVVLGSWWDSIRPTVSSDKLEYVRLVIATRMDFGETPPEL